MAYIVPSKNINIKKKEQAIKRKAVIKYFVFNNDFLLIKPNTDDPIGRETT